MLKPMHDKQAAEDESDTYNNHYAELRPDEQPRARSTTPTQSLPATTRPAGAGSQCRAGSSHRLVALSTMLCFTPSSLCANFELSEYENYEKELPVNVVDPLCASIPLSALQLKNLPLYEKESLSALQPKDLSLYEKETLSTLQSQYVMVTSSSPLSASLSLPDNGTSGGPGLSTGNHWSHPPALQPGTWDRIKNACLRNWSIKKQALSWAMYMTKEMMRTFRSEEFGVFKLLCWECQKSRSYMDDDVCREYTLVGKNGGIRRECQCTSTLDPVL